jgi:hypothetical protein
MQSIIDLNLLVEKYAALPPELNLDGDEQEEYSTMLLRLQNQVETGDPSEWIVNECVAWLAKFNEPSKLNAGEFPRASWYLGDSGSAIATY